MTVFHIIRDLRSVNGIKHLQLARLKDFVLNFSQTRHYLGRNINVLTRVIKCAAEKFLCEYFFLFTSQ